jgi:hypothetical protein
LNKEPRALHAAPATRCVILPRRAWSTWRGNYPASSKSAMSNRKPMKSLNGFTRFLVSPKHNQNASVIQIQRRCALRPRRNATLCRVWRGHHPDSSESAMSKINEKPFMVSLEFWPHQNTTKMPVYYKS